MNLTTHCHVHGGLGVQQYCEDEMLEETYWTTIRIDWTIEEGMFANSFSAIQEDSLLYIASISSFLPSPPRHLNSPTPSLSPHCMPIHTYTILHALTPVSSLRGREKKAVFCASYQTNCSRTHHLVLPFILPRLTSSTFTSSPTITAQ